MQIKYSRQAAKTISRLSSPIKQRIKAAIEKLPDGDIKQIKGYSITTYRLRVGGWRVLYSFDDSETIFIEKIAPRGEVYKGV